jgi:hypothetical protein
MRTARADYRRRGFLVYCFSEILNRRFESCASTTGSAGRSACGCRGEEEESVARTFCSRRDVRSFYGKQFFA